MESLKTENENKDVCENVKTQHIINEDCIKGMKEMKADSVDIIICDPPYNIGKDFGNFGKLESPILITIPPFSEINLINSK